MSTRALRALPGYVMSRPWQRGLLLSEYLDYGLDTQPAAVARDYLGAYGAMKLAFRLNQLSNRRGLVADKLLFDAMLRGAGLPVPELRAVYGRPPPMGVPRLHAAAGIERLLRADGALPVFGKPAMGERSDAVLAITGINADGAVLADGQVLPLDHLETDLRRHHRGRGYLFQGFIAQHPDIVAAIGPTVGTLRLVTLVLGQEVHVLAAVWKIPRAGAMADNVWRGNLVAPVDAESGIVGAARNGLGARAARLTTHPDTGAALDGLQLPNWPKVLRLTRRAAGLLHMLPLVGWDIAIGPEGPIFVEANTSPSLEAWQGPLDRGALAGDSGVLLRRGLEEIWQARQDRLKQRRVARRGLVLGRLRRR
ncbi:MAG: hypothetical protein GC146_12970 [Limimaricola sp.]|uniref:sugar-transfer associated ATP-grasp domain-containing protein n=1 Tax=Limimaricola sp. TaxID=2211665 RepID=UPI001D238C52|nr:sugar-transfer associated ATP-grasp domain-containing protein [Limimaricola sp.]MBI1418127.1 hypothetical protein [Limimaricola sp.]